MGAIAQQAFQTVRNQQTPTAKFESSPLLKQEIAAKLVLLQEKKSHEGASASAIKSETAPLYVQQARGMDEKCLLLVGALVVLVMGLSILVGRLIKRAEDRRIEKQARDERRQMLKEDADRQLKEIEKKNGS